MILIQLGIAFAMLLGPLYTYADRFSEIAEAHNMIDYRDRILPYVWPVSLTLFGYIKGEGIFDSRQNFVIRDGQLLYFPLPKMPDLLGKDINDRGEFDEFAIQTRLDISGRGPQAGCFDTSFLIEADFFARTDATINNFDVRLAYLELTSDHLDIRAGQDFHPLCIPIEFPDTISFNCGVPIAPYAFCPQLRVTYHTDIYEVMGAAIGFLGDRPFGPPVPKDKGFRDAIMPDFSVLMKFKKDEQNYLGFTYDVNRILPRLVTDDNYKERSLFTSSSVEAFSRFQRDDFVLYTRALWGQDLSIVELIGGFATHHYNPATDEQTYVPLATAAFSAELIKQGWFEPALFVGIVKNLGTHKTIIPVINGVSTIFGLGTNIDTVFRVSPRVRWYFDSLVVGVELEYTRAAYGTVNDHGRVIDAVPVGNTRFLFATYYVF